jgi:hypothetical protein
MRTRTKVALTVAATLGTGFLGGLVIAAPAHATPAAIGHRDDHSANNFRDELRYTGLAHEDSDNALDLAIQTCMDRSQGASSAWLIRRWDSDPYYTVEQAVEIVRGGEWHFCSEYMDD